MTNTEILFKIVEIVIEVLGLTLIIFGWVIPYHQSLRTEALRRKNDNKAEKIRWEKELIDQQISNLYGPIYALIIEDDVQFSRILYQFGRRVIFPKDQGIDDLTEEEQKIWKHYVDTYKVKRQMKMVEIMRNNFHLIYNSEIPTCYKDLLDYSLGWEMLDNQKRNGVPNHYEYHYVFNYPIEFNRYIKNTLEILLSEQAKLINISEKISQSTAF